MSLSSRRRALPLISLGRTEPSPGVDRAGRAQSEHAARARPVNSTALTAVTTVFIAAADHEPAA